MNEDEKLRPVASTGAGQTGKRYRPQRKPYRETAVRSLWLIIAISYAAAYVQQWDYLPRRSGWHTETLRAQFLGSLEEVETELIPVVEELRVQHYIDRTPEFLLHCDELEHQGSYSEGSVEARTEMSAIHRVIYELDLTVLEIRETVFDEWGVLLRGEFLIDERDLWDYERLLRGKSWRDKPSRTLVYCRDPAPDLRPFTPQHLGWRWYIGRP